MLMSSSTHRKTLNPARLKNSPTRPPVPGHPPTPQSIFFFWLFWCILRGQKKIGWLPRPPVFEFWQLWQNFVHFFFSDFPSPIPRPPKGSPTKTFIVLYNSYRYISTHQISLKKDLLLTELSWNFHFGSPVGLGLPTVCRRLPVFPPHSFGLLDLIFKSIDKYYVLAKFQPDLPNNGSKTAFFGLFFTPQGRMHAYISTIFAKS